MKIRIKLSHEKWDTSLTGKGKFILRLIPELKKLGCEITDDINEPVDVDFQISRWHYKPTKCKKTVLRIGPAHVDSAKNHKWLNSRKAKAIKRADGVIFQSKFGRKMVKNFIAKPKGLSTVILNGAPVGEYKNGGTEEAAHVYNFLASTRIWKKQKRLMHIKKGFLEACIPSSCLWIAGDDNRQPGEERFDNDICIKRIGPCDDNMLLDLYTTCDALIHMVWLDCCPNQVVEALAGGCKVICNNAAGTKELVEPSGGIVLDTEKKWNKQPVKTECPPTASKELIAWGLKEILKKDPPKTDHIDIKNIAKQYYDFFRKVLG